MKPSKPIGINFYDWERALEETKLMGNWLDYLIGWIPICNRWLWGIKAYAFLRGRESYIKDWQPPQKNE